VVSSHNAPTSDQSGSRSVFWQTLRILNVRLRFILLMVVVGLIASQWENIMNRWDRWTRPAATGAAVESSDVEYFCPMHPNIVRATEGTCPICGMPLSRRDKTDAAALPQGVLAQVELTPLKVRMGRIATSPVEYRMLAREIRTVGIVDYDITKVARVSARVEGRLDKLFVNFVGQRVNKGDPLYWIYSPNLLVAQQELLSAIRAAGGRDRQGQWSEADRETVSAAKLKLRLWDITDEQIEEIIRHSEPEQYMKIFSHVSGIVTPETPLPHHGHYVKAGDGIYTIADLSTVWMQAKIFEHEIGGVSIGTAVEVTSTAYPHEVFAGRITFIAFTVDSATRTVSARVEIANSDYKLKPGMYATAAIRLPVGEVTEITATSGPAEKEADTTAITKAYVALAEELAADKANDGAVKKLIAEADALTRRATGTEKTLAEQVAKSAAEMVGKNLDERRKPFKPLSEAMIRLIRARRPSETLFLTHCPMVPGGGGDWLAKSEQIANPYFGSQMLRCGTVKETIAPGGVSDSDRFVEGFFCPVFPDRLFEKPQHCPLDKFPMKRVRVEKVAAVPESAVINTGTRQVVYRERAPGSFEMIEVKLSQRAGEFYPVVEGVKVGDRVATAGAFLVDAENRLNPAAAAQYFGASDAPKASEPSTHGGH
jgi:membrane fusion protein, copper/silver efflux system